MDLSRSQFKVVRLTTVYFLEALRNDFMMLMTVTFMDKEIPKFTDDCMAKAIKNSETKM